MSQETHTFVQNVLNNNMNNILLNFLLQHLKTMFTINVSSILFFPEEK